MTEDGGGGGEASSSSDSSSSDSSADKHSDVPSSDSFATDGRKDDPIQPDVVSAAGSGVPPKSGMSTGARVVIGCGVVAVLLFIGGCAAVVFGANALRDEIENGNIRITDTAVTIDQFNRVQNGQTLEQVEDIFGGPGVGSGPSAGDDTTSETYIWNGEGLGDVASVTFRDNQVVAKYQFGLDR